MANKKLVPYIYAYEAIHDRAMKISIAGKPHNLHIIQVYMPTGDAHEEEIEAIYASIDTITQAIPSKESLLVIGDFNAKVGNNYCDHLKGTVGRYGLGERNERGERLIQFALDHSLAITNTMFQEYSRRLSTWISPNRLHRNQIDYILTRSRWRSSIKSVKVKPRADCDTDQKLLIGIFHLKLQRPQQGKANKKMEPYDKCLFREKLENSLDAPLKETANDTWKYLKDKKIVEAAKEPRDPVIQKRKHWLTDANSVKERRRLKTNWQEALEPDLKLLNRKIKNGCKKDKNAFL